MDYYRRKSPLEALALSLLDTAVVDIERIMKRLYEEGYTPPSRQLFEKHPALGFSWEEFQRLLNLSHGRPLPHGGSRPETPKIKATRAMCENVQNDFVNSDPKPTIKSLGVSAFCEKVRIGMRNAKQEDLFQLSAAKEFFRKSRELEKYRVPRGRPRKEA